MKLLMLAFVVILSGSAASCAVQETIAYDNEEGATQSQMLKDRYDCYQETAARTESAGVAVNQYGGAGSSSSRVIPECSAFAACMAARGYIRNPEGPLVVPDSAIVRCNQ